MVNSQKSATGNQSYYDDSLQGYFSYLQQFKILSPKEEVILAKKKSAGDKAAREMLICCNLRLVVSIAKKYSHYAYSLMDLIQIGNEGLIKGIDKYDWKSGCRISTYVTWWIKKEILQAVTDDGDLIRISDRVKELGRTDIPYVSCSLDDIVYVENEESGQKLKDTIPSNEPLPEDILIEKELKTALYAAIDSLETKEREVIESRFGLRKKKRKTLEEIGKEMGYSREWIRIIESRALDKLKSPDVSGKIKEYL